MDELKSDECYMWIWDMDNARQQYYDRFSKIPKELVNFYGSTLDSPGDLASTYVVNNYSDTSELKENHTTYSVNNLFFNNEDKYWVEGVKGYGIGEK